MAITDFYLGIKNTANDLINEFGQKIAIFNKEKILINENEWAGYINKYIGFFGNCVSINKRNLISNSENRQNNLTVEYLIYSENKIKSDSVIFAFNGLIDFDIDLNLNVINTDYTITSNGNYFFDCSNNDLNITIEDNEDIKLLFFQRSFNNKNIVYINTQNSKLIENNNQYIFKSSNYLTCFILLNNNYNIARRSIISQVEELSPGGFNILYKVYVGN